MATKYYGVFVDGKLARTPIFTIEGHAANHINFWEIQKGEVCEVRITRVRKTKKASKK